MSQPAAWRDPLLPRYRPEPPPPWLSRLRAGVFCGQPGHPAEVLERVTARGLEAAITDWRCSAPGCGRPSL